MESWLSRITDYLLAQSWQIAVMIVVVAIVSFLLRNRSAHVRYLIWLLVLAKCLVPPLHSVPFAVLPQEQPIAFVESSPMAGRTFDASRIERDIVTEPAISASVQTPMAPPPKTTKRPITYNIRAWLAIGWLMGVVALLFYNLLNALRTQIWLQRQRTTLPIKFRHNVEGFFSAHGVKHIPNVWLINGMNQPFVWGLVRGSIYLPADLLNVQDSKSWASLLGHELSHVIRFDAIVHTLQIFAQVVFWFHPFVWWANRKIRAEREKCCDEMAIVSLHALPEDYSEAIVEALAVKYESIRPVPSLAVAGPVKNIEERIKTMLKPGKKFYKRPSLIAAITVLLVAFLTVPTAFVLSARSGTKAPVPPLHKAAADGNLAQVRLLITKGASINAKDNEGRTSLFYTVENGHILMLDLLIAKGADIDAKDATGDTPLHHAARHDWRLAAELARRGADVNVTNNRRQTPLHVALEGGGSKHRHVASMLLWHEVNVNAKDSKGKTALHLAAQRAVEHRERWNTVLRGILAKGAEVNLTDAKGQTALHVACNHKNSAKYVVKTILERAKGVNPNVVDNNNATPLQIAALRGQTDACELLIANGTKVDTKDKSGRTPAHHALQTGNIETANTLIKNGADISSIHLSAYKGNLSNLKTLLTRGASANEKDETGFTALHAAAAGGRRDVVEYLISQGADVKVEGGPGWTALSYAARDNAKEVVELLRAKGVGGGKEVSRLLPVVIERGYREMATILIALGADINVNNGEPLTTAVRCAHKEIVELLISKGADVNAREGQQIPLYAAAASGRIDIAECLIDAGANINGQDARDHGCPLEAAVDSEDMKMIEFLLSKGADVNKGGWTPLHHAVHVGNRDIVAFLIKHGADIDQGGGYSSLGLAAWYVPEFVELLIDSGGNVNAIAPKWGWTPLHWAVYGNNRDVFDLLISRGADINARTHTEETVLHLPIQWGRKANQVKFVLSRGVDINAADACGWTALHRAVLYNRPEIAELLIAKGADVNLKDSDGRTSLWLAKENGYDEVVELLRKHGAKE